jgi:hypothetical protein
MPQCGVMGEAAGTAAFLSLAGDLPPRRIDVQALQAQLRKQGCIVDEADIEAAKKADGAKS